MRKSTKTTVDTVLWARQYSKRLITALLVGWALSMLFPRMIARIFTTDQTLLDLAAKGIKIDMLVFFVVGSQAVITNFFQCIGMVKVSIFLSLSRQLFLLLPMAYVFPLFWELDGVWYSMPASDFGSFAMTIPMLMWYMKRLRRNKLEVKSE